MARKASATPSAKSRALAPIPQPERALAKISGAEGTVSREEDTILVSGRSYAAGPHVIPLAEIFFVGGSKPRGHGPWLDEADKVAWRDERSGYECIMMRARDGGYLSGYVGIPEGHPLWGWMRDAVTVDLGIEVHGGLTYSAICQAGPSPRGRLVAEAQRVCHVPERPVRFKPLRHASGYRVEDAHAWWFGFDCNHVYDLVPGEVRHGRGFLAMETGRRYRDDAYVVREILNLAMQLRAIADGRSPPGREGPALPPIGLDPQRGK